MTAEIVIIEDNTANSELMTYLLNAAGHATAVATDGEAGVALVRRLRPRLVLCDMQLPRLDGFGVLAALARDGTERPLMVAVTALAMRGDAERIKSAGFDDYLSKPIEPEDFVPCVERWLRMRPGGQGPP